MIDLVDGLLNVLYQDITKINHLKMSSAQYQPFCLGFIVSKEVV